MGGDQTASLPTDVNELQHLVGELRKENSVLLSKSTVLEEELRLQRHELFGQRSERFTAEDEQQNHLFDEAESLELEQKDRAEPEAESTIEVAGYKRAKRGRRPTAEDLPREEVIHDISEEEKQCSC